MKSRYIYSKYAPTFSFKNDFSFLKMGGKIKKTTRKKKNKVEKRDGSE